MKSDKSDKRISIIVLILAILTSFGTVQAKPVAAPEPRSAVDAPNNPEFVVNYDKENKTYKAYEYHRWPMSNDYLCTIEADGSCDDSTGKIDHVVRYSYTLSYTYSSGSKVERTDVYIFQKNNQTVYHDTDTYKVESTHIPVK